MVLNIKIGFVEFDQAILNQWSWNFHFCICVEKFQCFKPEKNLYEQPFAISTLGYFLAVRHVLTWCNGTMWNGLLSYLLSDLV